MYIDSHVHGDPTAIADPAAYIAACRQRGIEAIVLIEPLARCLEAVERYGEFIIPVARIDMDGRSRCCAQGQSFDCHRFPRRVDDKLKPFDDASIGSVIRADGDPMFNPGG